MMINESKMGRLYVVDSERKIFSGEFDFVELRGAPGDRCLIDLTLRCPRSGKEMYAKLDNCVRTVSAGPVCLFAKFDHNGFNEPRVAYPACEAAWRGQNIAAIVFDQIQHDLLLLFHRTASFWSTV